MEYSQEIKNAVDNHIFPKAEIYEFAGSDLETLLNGYYTFCRDNLDIQSQQEKIAPNVFLFNNSYEVNAGAGIINGHFVISINQGLFRSCIENYYNNTALRTYFESLYPAQ